MYCSKCGKEMFDDAVICTGCGCLLKKEEQKADRQETFVEWNDNSDSSFKKIAQICCIISLSLLGLTEVFRFVREYEFSFVFALLSLAGTITEFVYSRKQTSESVKSTAVILLAASITTFCTACICTACILLS